MLIAIGDFLSRSSSDIRVQARSLHVTCLRSSDLYSAAGFAPSLMLVGQSAAGHKLLAACSLAAAIAVAESIIS